MDIVYLKLTNGDEIFANRISEETNTVLLDNVMVMETYHADADSKYLFMARYTQYCNNHSLTLDRTHIVFMNEASETVKQHYLISVRYAERITDEKFHDGMTDASRNLSGIMLQSDRVITDPDSSTRH